MIWTRIIILRMWIRALSSEHGPMIQVYGPGVELRMGKKLQTTLQPLIA